MKTTVYKNNFDDDVNTTEKTGSGNISSGSFSSNFSDSCLFDSGYMGKHRAKETSEAISDNSKNAFKAANEAFVRTEEKNDTNIGKERLREPNISKDMIRATTKLDAGQNVEDPLVKQSSVTVDVDIKTNMLSDKASVHDISNATASHLLDAQKATLISKTHTNVPLEAQGIASPESVLKNMDSHATPVSQDVQPPDLQKAEQNAFRQPNIPNHDSQQLYQNSPFQQPFQYVYMPGYGPMPMMPPTQHQYFMQYAALQRAGNQNPATANSALQNQPHANPALMFTQPMYFYPPQPMYPSSAHFVGDQVTDHQPNYCDKTGHIATQDALDTYLSPIAKDAGGKEFVGEAKCESKVDDRTKESGNTQPLAGPFVAKPKAIDDQNVVAGTNKPPISPLQMPPLPRRHGPKPGDIKIKSKPIADDFPGQRASEKPPGSPEGHQAVTTLYDPVPARYVFLTH